MSLWSKFLTLFNRENNILTEVNERTKDIMATLQSGFNDLSAAITTLGTDMSAGFTSVLAEINALQGQQSPVTGDQLEGLATQVNALKSGFDSFVSSAVPPAPPAPPPAPAS